MYLLLSLPNEIFVVQVPTNAIYLETHATLLDARLLLLESVNLPSWQTTHKSLLFSYLVSFFRDIFLFLNHMCCFSHVFNSLLNVTSEVLYYSFFNPIFNFLLVQMNQRYAVHTEVTYSVSNVAVVKVCRSLMELLLCDWLSVQRTCRYWAGQGSSALNKLSFVSGRNCSVANFGFLYNQMNI